MTPDEYVAKLQRLPERDRDYLMEHFQEVLATGLQVSHVIMLEGLYLQLKKGTSGKPSWVWLEELREWCHENCTGRWDNITVTNWAFELELDAIQFRLTWG